MAFGLFSSHLWRWDKKEKYLHFSRIRMCLERLEQYCLVPLQYLLLWILVKLFCYVSEFVFNIEYFVVFDKLYLCLHARRIPLRPLNSLQMKQGVHKHLLAVKNVCYHKESTNHKRSKIIRGIGTHLGKCRRTCSFVLWIGRTRLRINLTSTPDLWKMKKYLHCNYIYLMLCRNV